MDNKNKRKIFLSLLLVISALLLWWIASRPSVQSVSRKAEVSAKPLPAVNQHPIASSQKEPFMPAYIPTNNAGHEFSEPATEYRLAGKVIAETGDALPGAKITIHASGPQRPQYEWVAPIASDTSDSEGNYLIQIFQPMVNAAIRVERDGFATLEDSQRMSVPGTVTKNYKMKAAPACVAGLISGQEGKPLARAAIMVSVDQIHSGGELDLSHFSIFGHTGVDGKFLIEALPEDRIHVYAMAPGHLQRSTTIALKAGPCGHVDFTLEAGHALSFRVTDSRGRPISGAIMQSTVGSTRADENGSVDLVIPAETGPFECKISARGYRPKTIGIDPQDPPQRVFLENGDLLIGRVLSMAGKPIAGARVMATGSRPIAGSTANTPLPAPVIAMVDGVAETEADGGFSLVLSNPPATAIYVTKTGYVEQRRIIDSVEMMRHVEIRLQPANAGIFGRVLDFSDNPVRKFSISLASQGMPGTNAYTRTFEDKEGRFSVRDVAPGVYMLVVHADYRIANTLRFGQVEIREGLMYGEIVMHFPKANIK